MMKRSPPAGAQAVLRAISLLKAFPPDRPERDVAELASAAGLSRSTTHRLLAALESEGLVTRAEGSNRYRLGPETVVLGARALRGVRLRETVRQELQRLAEETGETATLEVLTQGKMLILDEVLGAHLVGASPSLGTSWALHATSTGKALLAELPRARILALIAQPLARFTERTIVSLSALEDELSRIRQDGFATVSGELEEGYAAAGAVIHVPMTEPYASLSVGGPSARLQETELRELGGLLKARAEEVSRRLGHEPV
ncbi:MAG TPA: IclR family transcriptional regulator [Vicinamibacteria bacterium]|jgi:DNA-binding IclR family transcriptional regulator